MDVDAHYEWPDSISSLSWPRDGIMYSYEHRGYIIPDKLECWLNRAFGVGKAKFVLFNQRIYIKAPRKPTSDERQWIEDGDRSSGVEVAECGWLTLPQK